MKNPLISVIVPVYCAENTLDRCVNSIINQTYSNWELLLVDDGSPDNCPKKCDLWAKRDSRIKVLHKVNEGVCGEYLTFLDSDDSLVESCFEKCLDIVSKYDLDALQFQLLKIYIDGKTSKVRNFPQSDVCNFEEYIKSGRLSGCGGGNFFKVRYIDENKIRYNQSLHYLEDAFFNLDYFSYCKRIMSIGDYFYHYYYNPNGSDKPKDWDYYLDSIEYGADFKKSKPECGFLIDGWCTMLAMRYVKLSDKHSYKRFAIAWRNLHLTKEYLSHTGRRDIVFFEKTNRLVGIKAAFYLTKIASRIYDIVNKN